MTKVESGGEETEYSLMSVKNGFVFCGTGHVNRERGWSSWPHGEPDPPTAGSYSVFNASAGGWECRVE